MNLETHFPILLLFIGGIFLTLGDVIMKFWVINNNIAVYFYALAFYLVGLNFLAYSFKYKNIAIASIMMIVFNVITLYFINWIFFKEKISLLQTLGLLLGLCSIIILEFADSK